MNDSSPNDPRHPQRVDVTRQVAASDWTPGEIDLPPEDIPKRERLFPRKVLIGWALFALALYFGVTMVGRIFKETVKSAVVNAAEQSGQKEIIFRSRSGHVTISRDKPNGSISITSEGPGRPTKTVTFPGAAAKVPTPPKPPTTVTVSGEGITVTSPPAAPAPTPTKR